MSIVPEFNISLKGGWLFSLFFLFLHLIFAIYSPQFRRKVLKAPKVENIVQKLSMIFSFLLFQSKIVLALFIPIKIQFPSFYIGAVFYLSALICYILTLITFINTSDDKPAMQGFYNFTRNPQQIFTIIIWTSTGLMLGTFLFLFIGIIEFFVSYPGFIAQERFCISKYGEAYKSYMKRTPRYIFF